MLILTTPLLEGCPRLGGAATLGDGLAPLGSIPLLSAATLGSPQQKRSRPTRYVAIASPFKLLAFVGRETDFQDDRAAKLWRFRRASKLFCTHRVLDF